MPGWGSPKPSWSSLVSAGSWTGAAEAPGTGRGFLEHPQLGWEVSPHAGGAEPSVSLSAEPLLIPSLLFLAQQPRAVGFSVFFFSFFSLPVNSKSFPSFAFYSGMLPAPFGFDLH